MSDRELSPLSGEKVGDKKELRKRERKLTERLQEAQREQAEALERLRRAEIRMRKRMARVQSLEDSLNTVHQQLEALQAPHATIVTMIASNPRAFPAMIEAPTAPTQEEALPEVESNSAVPLDDEVDVYPDDDEAELAQMVAGETESHYLERFADMDLPYLLPLEEHIRIHEMQHWQGDEEVDEEEPDNDEVLASGIPVEPVMTKARKARAVAEAAEEAARIAVERADSVEEYLEQVGSARHLMQEFERLQVEAEEALARSREANEAALLAEHLLDSTREDAYSEVSTMSPIEDERPDPIVETAGNDRAQLEKAPGLPSPLEVAQVEEIEEEEEDLETVTAMIIADAAATAAAQAEAIAEGCSARTREARAFVLKADKALDAVRDAILKQKLSGEGAEVALKAAEREATHAHASLADAEAAEEHALNMAMNAEAEAEVAEGMAFAASSRDERDEKLRNQNTFASSVVSHVSSNSRTASDDEFDDDTVEMPVIHPQKG